MFSKRLGAIFAADIVDPGLVLIIREQLKVSMNLSPVIRFHGRL